MNFVNINNQIINIEGIGIIVYHEEYGADGRPMVAIGLKNDTELYFSGDKCKHIFEYLKTTLCIGGIDTTKQIPSEVGTFNG